MTNDEFERIVPNSRDPYGPGFFKFTENDHGWSNRLFGDVIYHVFRPKSAVEFGCGTGATLAALRRQGVHVTGIDVSDACLPFIERHDPVVAKSILIHDLAKPIDFGRAFDLSISIETLEHIEPAGADNAVKSICDSAHFAIVTACPPVGRNPLHLNEQPFDYWIEKFKTNSFDLDVDRTAAVTTVMKAFGMLQTQEKFPVVPTWYFGGYIGVFAR